MFEDTKAVAFALDGTVYRGSQLIDGVDEVIRHCRKLGKSIFFLTNNSSETRSQIFHKLRGMGIDCTFREVLTSGYAQPCMHIANASPTSTCADRRTS